MLSITFVTYGNIFYSSVHSDQTTLQTEAMRSFALTSTHQIFFCKQSAACQQQTAISHIAP